MTTSAILRGRAGASLLPGLILAVLLWLVALPILGVGIGVFWSVSPGEPGGTLTLQHLVSGWTSPQYLEALKDTLLLAGSVALLATPLGMAMAWLVTRTDLPGRGLFRRLMIIPIFISPLVATLAWIALASPRTGFLNVLFAQALGRPGTVLFDIFSFAGMLLVMVTHYASYAFVYGASAFAAIDASLEEASTMAGAKLATTLRHVVLPLVIPSMLASGLMVFVLSAEQFAVPSLLGRSANFETLPSLIFYRLEYAPIDPHGATVAGSMLLAVTAIGLLLFRSAVGNARKYVTVSGKGGRPARTIALSRTVKICAVAALALYFLVTILLPLLAIAFGSALRFLTPNAARMVFTADNYRVFLEGEFLKALTNTAILGVTVSLLAVGLGLLVAFAVARGWRFARLMDYLASLPTALPGLALALGLLWIYSFLPLGLYGTLGILVVAYVARFLAHAVRLTGAGLSRLGPELDEAGRVAGAGPIRRLATIHMPLVRGNVAAAMLLIFIYAVIEVSATIVLYAPDTITVSVFMWRGMQMAGSVKVFAIATVQCLVIGTLVLLAFRWIDPSGAGRGQA